MCFHVRMRDRHCDVFNVSEELQDCVPLTFLILEQIGDMISIDFWSEPMNSYMAKHFLLLFSSNIAQF
jgi:hypothetical protein